MILLGLDFNTYHGKGITVALRTRGERSELRLGNLLKQLATSPRGDREHLRGHFPTSETATGGLHGATGSCWSDGVEAEVDVLREQQGPISGGRLLPLGNGHVKLVVCRNMDAPRLSEVTYA